MPRLLRDAPLNGIWEGSGNVIALDVLRALSREPDGPGGVPGRVRAGPRRRTRGSTRTSTRCRRAIDPWSARRAVEELALAFQASLLCATRRRSSPTRSARRGSAAAAASTARCPPASTARRSSRARYRSTEYAVKCGGSRARVEPLGRVAVGDREAEAARGARERAFEQRPSGAAAPGRGTPPSPTGRRTAARRRRSRDEDRADDAAVARSRAPLPSSNGPSSPLEDPVEVPGAVLAREHVRVDVAGGDRGEVRREEVGGGPVDRRQREAGGRPRLGRSAGRASRRARGGRGSRPRRRARGRAAPTRPRACRAARRGSSAARARGAPRARTGRRSCCPRARVQEPRERNAVGVDERAVSGRSGSGTTGIS